MFTSDEAASRREMGKISFLYLLVSLFCALFGAVYELFSHEVYSYFMLFAFAFPLAGGAIPFAALSLGWCKRLPGTVSRQLYHDAIAALTVGSVMTGVLEIYGTTNDLTRIYWYAGFGLLAAAVGTYGLGVPRKSSGTDESRHPL